MPRAEEPLAEGGLGTLRLDIAGLLMPRFDADGDSVFRVIGLSALREAG